MTELQIATAIPSPGDPNRPLVLLLHGYNSSERDLAGLFDCLPREYRYASLRAPLKREYGWAWFTLERDATGFVLGDVAAGRNAVLEWCRANGEQPVGAIGFSQGGALALELLRAGSVAWAAVLSGFVAPSDSAETAAADRRLAELKPPVFWGHGNDDPQIAPELAQRLEAWLQAHTELSAHRYAALGHAISATELADLSSWLRTRLAMA